MATINKSGYTLTKRLDAHHDEKHPAFDLVATEFDRQIIDQEICPVGQRPERRPQSGKSQCRKDECYECGKRVELFQDAEDGMMKCYNCCDILNA